MSRLVLKQTIETEIAAFLATLPMPLPFESSINEGKKVTHKEWVTCEFFALDNELLCYNGDKRAERGECEVLILVQPNKGFTRATEIADAIQDHFETFSKNNVQILKTNSAQERSLGDISARWYVVDVSINYIHYI